MWYWAPCADTVIPLDVIEEFVMHPKELCRIFSLPGLP
jgi:hypothetical protein